MAESQSRYGIMEELNNRKINQKEKLANLERETDNHIFSEEKKIVEIEQEIKDKESTYKIEHKERQRQREVNLRLLQGEYDRAKEKLETEIKEDKDSYESDFKKWKSDKQAQITKTKNELARYKQVQMTKIEEKKAIIAEIEQGVKDLKEVSAEQGRKEDG